MLSTQLSVPIEVIRTFAKELQKPTSVHIAWSFVKKVGSKERKLHDATYAFKGVARKINRMLQLIKLPPEIKGGVPRKSIKDGALPHLGCSYLYKLDIKDFFPSLHFIKIRNLFLKIGCAPQVAKLLTQLTTREGSIPQGFITSTTLANLYIAIFCYPEISKLISGKCRISYWVDDIAISSKDPIPYETIRKIVNILRKNHLGINSKKTVKKGPGGYKEITGVAINKGIKPAKLFIREIERDLFLLSKNGVLWLLQNVYKEKYTELIGKKRSPHSWLIENLKGRLLHIKMLNERTWHKLTVRYAESLSKLFLTAIS